MDSEENMMTDKEFFDGRIEDYAYITRLFPGMVTTSHKKRYILKKFIFEEEITYEKTRIKSEYVLRSSKTNKIQLKVAVIQDSHEIDSIVFQNFNGANPTGESISFRNYEFQQLLDFLSKIKFIDLSNLEKFRIRIGDIDTKKVLVNEGENQLIELLKTLKDNKRQLLLDTLSNEQFTKEDLDILSGRKKGLEEFHKNLFEENKWVESDWQAFFNNNTWIFGYGLDYKFLKILQKETRVSGIDLDGKMQLLLIFYWELISLQF